MRVLHVSTECYPAGKVGGLGDVVGALPKYLKSLGVHSPVVMPMYQKPWILDHLKDMKVVHEGWLNLPILKHHYKIWQLAEGVLPYELHFVQIDGLFDRPGIYADPSTGYAYWDEFQRNIAFQTAVLDWVLVWKHKPDILHCHDHPTGLIPFMMKSCERYKDLAETPTVLTIHNGEYHGMYDYDMTKHLPPFKWNTGGLLEWNGCLNALATGVKTSWKITTVSPSYLQELKHWANGLELLMQMEHQKSVGIINGIDTEVWNPEKDTYLEVNFNDQSVITGKWGNKAQLANEFGLDVFQPTFAFIGRLVREKGADILPDMIRRVLENGTKANFIILGNGDRSLHFQLKDLEDQYRGFVGVALGYNEELAHRIYAGSDFLLMPSRIEPCGLNQMYAMRYGTIPIVRNIGGLRDTVKDISEPGGYGIRFDDFSLESAGHAIERAVTLFHDRDQFMSCRDTIMSLDFSWSASARAYKNEYLKLTKLVKREA